jgi:phage-related holin
MIKRTLFLILTAMSLLTGPTSAAYGIYPALPQTPPGDFEVTFYPVAPYHTGDLLSARVAYTGSANIGGTHITVALADEPDQILETAAFSQNTRQATFYWMYDTRSHQTGYLSFRFEVPDFDLAWTQGVHLLPDLGNRSAAWSSAHSPCCTLHYFTGTDAEADLPEIITALEESSAEVLSQFAAAGVLEENPIQEPLSIVLVPMVIGHGGFATDEAVLTYTHDNWAGIEFTNLAHHEIVHVVDRLINTQGPRPSIFVEGLAVVPLRRTLPPG